MEAIVSRWSNEGTSYLRADLSGSTIQIFKLFSSVMFVEEATFFGSVSETVFGETIFEGYSVGRGRHLETASLTISTDEEFGIVTPTLPSETCMILDGTIEALEITNDPEKVPTLLPET